MLNHTLSLKCSILEMFSAITILTSSLLMCLSSYTLAGDTQIGFDILEQNIRSALIEFADITDLSLIYDIGELGPMETNRVSGFYSPVEALQIMLAGKGLKFVKIGEKSIAITKNEQPMPNMKEKSKKTIPSAIQENVIAKNEEIESEFMFTLEEIMVMAEKRSANVQESPSSVVALSGRDQTTQGKTTTAQILESISNITYRETYGNNPNGDIAIRGIQHSRQSGGGVEAVLPATTAVYVDGVYQGIGGNYDLSRVEVLRGPQGTLYGRSATGGVVSFYTNDPKLGEYGGNVSVEFGSYALKNLQAAINVPAGEKIALRAAAHYYTRDGYFDAEGGQKETKEGRLKVLLHPNDALEIVLSGSMEETVNWGGGWGMTLSAPNEINYHYRRTEPSAYPTQKYNQFGVNATYDFGNSTLTYLAGCHDYEYIGYGPVEPRAAEANLGADNFPTDRYHTQELRWASDTEGPITWLVGTNYFKQEFENNRIRYMVYNHADPEVPTDADPAPRYIRDTSGIFLNYGIFTEETFKLRDDFRITAGLRYDKTDFTQSMIYIENTHYTALRSPLNPPTWSSGSLIDDKHLWHNITYKLRFEYDVTADSMLYFTTATGFLPGFAAISPTITGGQVTGWEVRVLDEQKLTSYELGTKNQFLKNTLRLNASAFYYDLKGYPDGYNLLEGPGPSSWYIMSTPIEVIGAEAELEYLLTMNDKILFNAGYQRPKITDYPDTIYWRSGLVSSGKLAAMLDIQPGHPKFESTLAYDHTFLLRNGSMLLARADLLYTSSYYFTQMNYVQVNLGEKPYNHQDANELFNAGLSWTSPNQKYSIDAWVRNVFDKEYKTGVVLVSSPPLSNSIPVTPGDPRTFGVMVSLKF